MGKKKLAVFASGSGTNFEAIAQACADGRLDAEVALMVCDQPGAAVVARAERFGVPAFVASPKEMGGKAAFEAEIVRRMDALGIDLVCLAGYMRILSDVLLDAYGGRIINIHPSLLPAFRGAHAVEQAVAYGVKVYGITIHYVDAGMDTGKIIAQSCFTAKGNETLDEIETQIHALEHKLYPQVIQQLCKGE